MDAGERRITRQLDIVHFIRNSTILEALSKLNLSKTDRFLIRRQPKVHLLNQTSSSSSSFSHDQNAYKTDSNLSDFDDCQGLKLVELYFGANEKA